MARKVDAQVLARIKELKAKYGLTNVVIAERLGLGLRTVRHYLNLKDPCTTPESSKPASIA